MIGQSNALPMFNCSASYYNQQSSVKYGLWHEAGHHWRGFRTLACSALIQSGLWSEDTMYGFKWAIMKATSFVLLYP